VTWSALPEVAEAILLVEKCPPLLALDVEEVDDLARRDGSVSEIRVCRAKSLKNKIRSKFCSLKFICFIHPNMPKDAFLKDSPIGQPHF
jgi:hypothetical protein